jgi:hypothetical protein
MIKWEGKDYRTWQDALEKLRMDYDERLVDIEILNSRVALLNAERDKLRELLSEGLSLTDGLDDDSYLEPEHRACLVQWRDEIEALAAVQDIEDE